MRSAEYDEGAEAYKKGRPIESNPYEKAEWSGCYNDWNKGWRDAEVGAVQ